MSPRAPKLEDVLATIRRLRKEDGAAAELVEQLRPIVEHPSSHAVAAAARLAEERELRELVEPLAEAFGRFFDADDVGCGAKIAIARALVAFEYDDAELFLAGATHVQLEGGYGEPEDSAVSLRAVSAEALARCSWDGVTIALAEILVDLHEDVRTAAARALGSAGRLDAIPLLRYKAVLGDPDPRVLGECVGSILALEEDEGLPFVRRFLHDDDPEVVEMTALAFAESRGAKALEILLSWWRNETRYDLRRDTLASIALHRSDESLAFLLGIIREGTTADALAAVDAFAPFRSDPTIEAQLEEAVTERREAEPDFGRRR